MAENEQWEYLSVLLEADVDGDAKDYMRMHYPGTRLRRHTPIALIPGLNKYGEQGWELVHVQPVRLGGNLEINLKPGHTSTYLCIFKRRR